MNKWPEVALGDHAEFLTGFPFKSGGFVEEHSTSVRLLRGDNVAQGTLRWDGVRCWPSADRPQFARYELSEGDVILAMDRPWIAAGLKYAYVRGADLPALLVQRVARLRGSATLDTTFLRYVIGSGAFTDYVQGITTGTAVPHISGGDIQRFRFSLPPLPEQQRIAGILSAYDDLIEVNRRRIAVLNSMAQGLFEEWFVRFRFPGHDRVDLIDTTAGPLPAGWSHVPLSGMARFVNGYAFKPSHFEGVGTPIIKIPELKNGVTAKTPRTSADVPQDLHIEAGDLLFSWSGTLAVQEWNDEPGFLNQHLFVVRPFGSYGHGLLKEAIKASMPQFDLQAVGATMKHIRRSALDHTKWAMPPDGPLLRRANAFLTAGYEQLVTLGQSNRKLAAARDLILPRLLSGRLTLRAAERELAEAA